MRNLHQNIFYQRFRIYWSATLGLVWKGPGSSVVNDNTTIWLSIRGMVSYHFSSRSFQTWISSLHDNPYHQRYLSVLSSLAVSPETPMLGFPIKTYQVLSGSSCFKPVVQKSDLWTALYSSVSTFFTLLTQFFLCISYISLQMHYVWILCPKNNYYSNFFII